jgi:RNA polymerase sigma factor (sigma-70 family)
VKSRLQDSKQVYQMSTTDPIQNIKSNSSEALTTIYLDYKEEITEYYQLKYGIDEKMAIDIHSDALIVLRQNVISGRLVELSSSLKTYLISVGKNILFKKLRKRREEVMERNEIDLIDYSTDKLTDLMIGERDRKIEDLLKTLSQKCYQLLKLRYFEYWTYDAIAEELDFTNANSVRAQELRCRGKFRNRVINLNEPL